MNNDIEITKMLLKACKITAYIIENERGKDCFDHQIRLALREYLQPAIEEARKLSEGTET